MPRYKETCGQCFGKKTINGKPCSRCNGKGHVLFPKPSCSHSSLPRVEDEKFDLDLICSGDGDRRFEELWKYRKINDE